jgi:hypothetical protein
VDKLDHSKTRSFSSPYTTRKIESAKTLDGHWVAVFSLSVGNTAFAFTQSTMAKKSNSILWVLGLGAAGALSYFGFKKGKKFVDAVMNLDVSISNVKTPVIDYTLKNQKGEPQPVLMGLPLVFDIKNPSDISGSIKRIYGDAFYKGERITNWDIPAGITIKPKDTTQFTMVPFFNLARTLEILKVTGNDIIKNFSNVSAWEIPSLLGDIYGWFLQLQGSNSIPSNYMNAGAQDAKGLGRLIEKALGQSAINRTIEVKGYATLMDGLEIPFSKTFTI